MNYGVISKTCQGTYESVKIRIGDINISTAYLSPRATIEVRVELLQHVESHKSQKAITVGGINARH